eukprot:1637112-Rhodomonas_salina.4
MPVGSMATHTHSSAAESYLFQAKAVSVFAGESQRLVSASGTMAEGKMSAGEREGEERASERERARERGNSICTAPPFLDRSLGVPDRDPLLMPHAHHHLPRPIRCHVSHHPVAGPRLHILPDLQSPFPVQTPFPAPNAPDQEPLVPCHCAPSTFRGRSERLPPQLRSLPPFAVNLTADTVPALLKHVRVVVFERFFGVETGCVRV